MINAPMTSLINVSIHSHCDLKTFTAEKNCCLTGTIVMCFTELLIRPLPEDESPFFVLCQKMLAHQLHCVHETHSQQDVIIFNNSSIRFSLLNRERKMHEYQFSKLES